MNILADTNIIVRAVHRKAAQHRVAIRAMRSLQNEGHRICLTAQNLYEFCSVATCPVQVNGLGLTSAQTNRVVTRLEEICLIFRDPADLYDEWRRLIVTHEVSGKKVHDARLVAAMKIYGIHRILTFNTGDFVRFPEIEVIHPDSTAKI